CETTAPVTLEDRVAVPAGTFVQGKVEKLTRHGTRGEIVMRSVSIVFADGFVANIGGPITIESEEGTAWINPDTGTKAAMVAAPLVGLGLGTAIGAAAHTTRTINFGGTTMTTNTLKGVAIGSTLGLAAGAVCSINSWTWGFSLPEPSAIENPLRARFGNRPLERATFLFLYFQSDSAMPFLSWSRAHGLNSDKGLVVRHTVAYFSARKKTCHSCSERPCRTLSKPPQ